MRRLLPLALLLLAPPLALAAGKDTVIPDAALATATQLREAGLKDEVALAFTRDLTTQVGPRLAGSEADLKAREWTVARFKALGFDKVWTEPVTFPKWQRRSERAAILAPYPQPLAATALGYSPATPAGGLSAEVVGFDTLEALKNADPASVRGRIVYVGARMHAKRSGEDYGIGSSVRTFGPALASGKGAVAFLLRSAGTDQDRLPHTGVTHFGDDVTPIPAAALAAPDADQVERILAGGKPLKVELQLDCGFDGQYTGANVIGEFTGSKRPDEYYLMGGHLDSWDLGTGAIDDAAGVAIATAAARLIADLPLRPARSIRVVAFANEESGLYGAKAYAEAHRKEIAKIVLGSESDLGADRIYLATASVKPEARAAIAQIAKTLEPLGVAYDASQPGSGGSDLSAIHKVGMAGLSLHQDATRYFDLHHTANDTFDKIDPANLRQNVAVYAVVAYLAAQAQGDFGSRPGAFANDKPRD
ncbi:MAG: M20/M25/M40 family metallo-hydrolase [Dokdonella sp.]|uniref:M20/M25/M40 family metallo-hydrolase n=1 Tax=Dokdonella sp. TaxID=2291710 RepID=UPI0025BA208B|nr:M20/M25/M40 family metallo-hydrolase [Dokdonella sp.]MBX3702012.1 M20/M25/M40 family metallo-hydrolase [Dokdonella sp.]